MSSILEALKKLEDEKAARRSGSGSLAGKVAKTGRKPRPTPPWFIPGALLAVAAISVLVTYSVMSRTPSPATGPAPAQMQQEAAQPPAGQLPVTPLPAIATPVTDGLGTRRPAPPLEKKKSGSSAMRKEAAAQPKGLEKAASPLTADSGKGTPAHSGETLPKLNVVGIAWQKDTALRLAIVNGVPVREGGVVDGATVREILPDRVRFSVKGKDFDLPLEN
jgi:general secretion pathway protein B